MQRKAKNSPGSYTWEFKYTSFGIELWDSLIIFKEDYVHAAELDGRRKRTIVERAQTRAQPTVPPYDGLFLFIHIPSQVRTQQRISHLCFNRNIRIKAFPLRLA
ncbi:hypothetical protein ACQ4LE_004496 [Meloidogyne hapla]|uniref:Uncharacterized protein n=1 Tax=Meloidogyne hapla TaxID=6305 RepID=A0A1I8BAR5_MELHA